MLQLLNRFGRTVFFTSSVAGIRFKPVQLFMWRFSIPSFGKTLSTDQIAIRRCRHIFLFQGTKCSGPHNFRDIKKMVRSGQSLEGIKIWWKEDADWSLLSETKNLFL